MLNPKYQRYADRLKDLIEEGKDVAKLEHISSSGFRYIQNEDKIPLNAWIMKTNNIVETVFGNQSPHFRTLREVLPKEGIRLIETSNDIYPITGVLAGALDDLEKGFLIGQEFLIAGEVFDSILEQAKDLNKKDYKDPAAVLTRVVLEDAIRRLARREGLDDTQKASQINDNLKKLGIYPQAQWRFIQAWLDIGNAAAHGKFNEYTKDDVTNMIDGVEQFLLTELKV
jgi:hypothetical protein